eukprot:1142830-Amphidinium_carterae.1
MIVCCAAKVLPRTTVWGLPSVFVFRRTRHSSPYLASGSLQSVAACSFLLAQFCYRSVHVPSRRFSCARRCDYMLQATEAMVSLSAVLLEPSCSD